MQNKQQKINEALDIIIDLGLPKSQQNERTALCLLALLNLTPEKKWSDAESHLIGITPIMEWVKKYYDKIYAPNTRETIRRQSMHQFCDAGVSLYNPDNPARPVNSPKAVYQIAPHVLELIKCYGTPNWLVELPKYLQQRQTLVEQYAKERAQSMVPVKVSDRSFEKTS